MSRLRSAGAQLLLLACASACASPDGAQGPPRLTLLSYNIHHGAGTDGVFDLDRLARVIEDAGADVIALQEVDVETRRSSGVDQAAALGAKTGLTHAFARAIEYQGGEYGEALLTQLPLAETRAVPLRAQPGSEGRVALVATVDVAGTPVRIVATHLDHQSDPLDRLMQVEDLLQHFGEGDLPTLLLGDLNAEPGSPEILALSEAFTPAGGAHPPPTFPSHAPEVTIDWVLMRPAARWRVVDHEVLHAPVASDHAPLRVTLELLPLESAR